MTWGFLLVLDLPADSVNISLFQAGKNGYTSPAQGRETPICPVEINFSEPEPSLRLIFLKEFKPRIL